MIFIQLTDTERLTIAPLQEADHLFIMELLNTEGWIKFIGDRNVHSPEDALAYIHKVNANNAIRYWTVKTKHNNIPIGIVTLIQRDYLHQPDIGFAFLPAAAGKGYALEASAALMEKLLADNNIT
ncbi:MAG: N-acetyltransferase, partial [Chitinophagaceae bacterium]